MQFALFIPTHDRCLTGGRRMRWRVPDSSERHRTPYIGLLFPLPCKFELTPWRPPRTWGPSYIYFGCHRDLGKVGGTLESGFDEVKWVHNSCNISSSEGSDSALQQEDRAIGAVTLHSNKLDIIVIGQNRQTVKLILYSASLSHWHSTVQCRRAYIHIVNK